LRALTKASTVIEDWCIKANFGPFVYSGSTMENITNRTTAQENERLEKSQGHQETMRHALGLARQNEQGGADGEIGQCESSIAENANHSDAVGDRPR